MIQLTYGVYYSLLAILGISIFVNIFLSVKLGNLKKAYKDLKDDFDNNDTALTFQKKINKQQKEEISKSIEVYATKNETIIELENKLKVTTNELEDLKNLSRQAASLHKAADEQASYLQEKQGKSQPRENRPEPRRSTNSRGYRKDKGQ